VITVSSHQHIHMEAPTRMMRFATEVAGSAITMTDMKGWKKRM